MKTLIVTLTLIVPLMAKAHKAGDVLVLESFKNSDCVAIVTSNIKTNTSEIAKALKGTYISLNRNPTTDTQGRLDYHLTPMVINNNLILKNITCGKSTEVEPTVLAREMKYNVQH